MGSLGITNLHVVARAASLLLFLLSRTRTQETLRAIAILCLGFCLEFAQHLIYRNPVEWRDVRDDAIAILLAFTLYRLTGSWKPRGEAVMGKNYTISERVP